MSPQNLSDLPTSAPAPTGDAQVRRGAQNSEVGYNNTVSARPLIDAPAGNDMFIEVVPYYRGYWIVHAETIWRTVDAVWTYCHWGVRLTDGGAADTAKPDLNGYYDARNHIVMHSAQVWQESCLSTVFKLEMNTVYRAVMWWPNSSGGWSNNYFAGPEYMHIQGEFVEDGSL